MKEQLRIWIYSIMLLGASLMLTNSCKKDSVPIQKDLIPVYGEPVNDIEGNIYKTVIIGNQVWMAENLKSTKYRNGDSIPVVKDSTQWIKLSTGARCYNKNDKANGIKYGNLYNWYAVSDSRNIAPMGFHVPSDAEWDTLMTYVSAHLSEKNTMIRSLAAATNDWQDFYPSYPPTHDLDNLHYNYTKCNSSGFTGLPGGFRDFKGRFVQIGLTGIWWSTTEDYIPSAWGRS
jgi:uncharacterized protein (TIGR02145 family)